MKLPKARRSASLVAHKHFGAAVSRTAQLLVLILDSARTKCYATCSVSYRYFMHKYLFVPQSFPYTYRSLSHTSINADFPSGKAPTTRVRLRISRFIRSKRAFARYSWSKPSARPSVVGTFPKFVGYFVGKRYRPTFGNLHYRA